MTPLTPLCREGCGVGCYTARLDRDEEIPPPPEGGPQMKNFATQDALNEIERDMAQQGRGSTFIEVNETGRRLLRIMPQP
jgi:hypothetical protein